MWPFTRRREPQRGQGPPVAPGAPTPPGWRSVAPVAPTVSRLALTAPSEGFEGSLATRRHQTMVGPLAHGLSPDGPGGLIHGITRPAPAVQREPGTEEDRTRAGEVPASADLPLGVTGGGAGRDGRGARFTLQRAWDRLRGASAARAVPGTSTSPEPSGVGVSREAAARPVGTQSGSGAAPTRQVPPAPGPRGGESPAPPPRRPVASPQTVPSPPPTVAPHLPLAIQRSIAVVSPPDPGLRRAVELEDAGWTPAEPAPSSRSRHPLPAVPAPPASVQDEVPLLADRPDTPSAPLTGAGGPAAELSVGPPGTDGSPPEVGPVVQRAGTEQAAVPSPGSAARTSGPGRGEPPGPGPRPRLGLGDPVPRRARPSVQRSSRARGAGSSGRASREEEARDEVILDLPITAAPSRELTLTGETPPEPAPDPQPAPAEASSVSRTTGHAPSGDMPHPRMVPTRRLDRSRPGSAPPVPPATPGPSLPVVPLLSGRTLQRATEGPGRRPAPLDARAPGASDGALPASTPRDASAATVTVPATRRAGILAPTPGHPGAAEDIRGATVTRQGPEPVAGSVQRIAGGSTTQPPTPATPATPALFPDLPVARAASSAGGSGVSVGSSWLAGGPVVQPRQDAGSFDDGALVARSATPDGDGSAAPMTPVDIGPSVQRRVDGDSPPTAPTAAPTGVGAASGASAGTGAAGGAPSDLDELARRLYDRLRDRLRAELRRDRERVGLLVDDH